MSDVRGGPTDLLGGAYRAFLFDMDGVLTNTASLHNQAWKATFDRFLQEKSTESGEPYEPFDDNDYLQYVDGKIVTDGVRDFLASRDVHLPEGKNDDPPFAATNFGIAHQKADLFRTLMIEHGIDVYEGSVAFAKAAHAAGIHTAVVSASHHTGEILAAAGIADLFETRVDGVLADELGLKGKPAPDLFLEGARRLGATAAQSVVFEDALAGVAAGKAGGFGFVVGVDRHKQPADLLASGANIAVNDLSELLP